MFNIYILNIYFIQIYGSNNNPHKVVKLDNTGKYLNGSI